MCINNLCAWRSWNVWSRITEASHCFKFFCDGVKSILDVFVWLRAAAETKWVNLWLTMSIVTFFFLISFNQNLITFVSESNFADINIHPIWQDLSLFYFDIPTPGRIKNVLDLLNLIMFIIVLIIFIVVYSFSRHWDTTYLTITF